MSNNSNLISRTEISILLGITADQVRKNEHRWNIDRFRVDLNHRCVRYRRKPVLDNFKSRGWLL